MQFVITEITVTCNNNNDNNPKIQNVCVDLKLALYK